MFAVPGSVLNPAARDCHALLRNGARIADQASGILAEIAPKLDFLSLSNSIAEAVVDGDAAIAITHLQFAPCSVTLSVKRG